MFRESCLKIPNVPLRCSHACVRDDFQDRKKLRAMPRRQRQASRRCQRFVRVLPDVARTGLPRRVNQSDSLPNRRGDSALPSPATRRRNFSLSLSTCSSRARISSGTFWQALSHALMLSGCSRNALHTWSGVDPARIIRTALSCLKRSNLIDIDVRARSAS